MKLLPRVVLRCRRCGLEREFYLHMKDGTRRPKTWCVVCERERARMEYPPKQRRKLRCRTQDCGACAACYTRASWTAGHFDNIGAKRRDRWSLEEVDLLRAMAGCIGGAKQISAEFKRIGWSRSEYAISTRACELGVSLAQAYWGAKRVAEFFRVDQHALRKRWLLTGMLRAEKRPLGCGNGSGDWMIQEADIADFIRRCPWAYDASLITLPRHPLGQLARQIQARDPWLTADEVARRLGLSRSAVCRWCKRGVIAHERRYVGKSNGRYGAYVVRASELRHALEAIREKEEARREKQTRVLVQSRRARLAAAA